MAYSKPQVTIDLEEYQELLDFKYVVEKNDALSKEDVKPYQAAIGAMLSHILNRYRDSEKVNQIIDSVNAVDVTMYAHYTRGNAWDINCETKKTI